MTVAGGLRKSLQKMEKLQELSLRDVHQLRMQMEDLILSMMRMILRQLSAVTYS